MHSTYVKMAMDRQRAERLKRNRHQSKAVQLKVKLQDCCRKVIAFLFTQVGVCGLIVCYTIIGAFMFIAIESEATSKVTQEVIQKRRSAVNYLWNITHHLNVLHYDRWRQDVNRTVYEYQTQLVRQIRRGYDGIDENPNLVRWTIPSALMYCITIYTTIGYGNLTPRTPFGKIATIAYSLIGIPLMLLYMSNVGDILATSFKYTYNTMCRCPKRRRRTTNGTTGMKQVTSTKPATVETVESATGAIVAQVPITVKMARKNRSSLTNKGTTTDALSDNNQPSFKEKKRKQKSTEATSKSKSNNKKRQTEMQPPTPPVVVMTDIVAIAAVVDNEELQGHYEPQTVSVTSCLIVISIFVIGGAILFSIWEGWSYVDGSYFCFTSLLSIGFGDFVPGQTIYQTEAGQSVDHVDYKLIVCAVYLLLGMALLAMCFNLMQEEVFMKIKRFGRRLGLLRERFAP